MVDGVYGIKQSQLQTFLENGKRIPVTVVSVPSTTVIAVKTAEKEGYNAMQVGFGTKKNLSKALEGHIKGAQLTKAPFYMKEVRYEKESFEKGTVVTPDTILEPGDIVDIVGTSKGKGFAGVVKRHNFKGGPRTHGQSDRERAPGSIGQTTTPGRVYKGKRMAGRMGQDRVTIKNAQVVDVSKEAVVVKGLVPGAVKSLLYLKKVGKMKKFVPLYKELLEKPKEEVVTQENETMKEDSVTEAEVK